MCHMPWFRSLNVNITTPTTKVFHRDIKSQNILLDKACNAKIADFGLALLAQPDGGDTLKVEHTSGCLFLRTCLLIQTYSWWILRGRGGGGRGKV